MSAGWAAAGPLAATATSALGAVLYLVAGVLVLRLAIRWAREALGEAPVAVPRTSGPRG